MIGIQKAIMNFSVEVELAFCDLRVLMKGCERVKFADTINTMIYRAD